MPPIFSFSLMFELTSQEGWMLNKGAARRLNEEVPHKWHRHKDGVWETSGFLYAEECTYLVHNGFHFLILLGSPTQLFEAINS